MPPFSTSYQGNSGRRPVATSAATGADAAGPPAGPQRRTTAGSSARAQLSTGAAAAAAGTATARLRGTSEPCLGTVNAAPGRRARGATYARTGSPRRPAVAVASLRGSEAQSLDSFTPLRLGSFHSCLDVYVSRSERSRLRLRTKG